MSFLLVTCSHMCHWLNPVEGRKFVYKLLVAAQSPETSREDLGDEHTLQLLQTLLLRAYTHTLLKSITTGWWRSPYLEMPGSYTSSGTDLGGATKTLLFCLKLEKTLYHNLHCRVPHEITPKLGFAQKHFLL